MIYEYDMIVIGGGAAGLTAAGMSALLGARTALVEKDRLGGDCTWTGCIPSKTLLRAGRVAYLMRTADRFGLAAAEPQVDFRRVMDHVRETRRQIYEAADAPPHLEKLGVEVIAGNAQFVDDHTVEAGSRRLTSRFFVIATGSRPRTGEFAETPLTNETIFELQRQPKRLVIMGAGPVGIEMAQAFQRLGSAVTVVAAEDRILPRDDEAHARQLQNILEREGVTFVRRQKVAKLEKRDGVLAAILENGAAVPCDAALAAMGREPVTGGLRLGNAGVDADKTGIPVDSRCRTSQRHIFAAGDVTGRFQFTHMAEHMAKIAVTNAILRWPKKLDYRRVVWSTFTEPELAHLGESEEQLHKQNRKFDVFRFAFSELDRAVTDNKLEGEVKVFAGRSGRILGASILGTHAGELITEYALAMRHGIRLGQIADTIHPYPTYMLANRRAADKFTAKNLDSPLLGWLSRMLRYRGTRKGSRAL